MKKDKLGPKNVKGDNSILFDLTHSFSFSSNKLFDFASKYRFEG